MFTPQPTVGFRACELTHQNFSAYAGRFARVFVGLAEGWIAGSETMPTAEDIAAHLDDVTGVERYTIPTSIFDEIFQVCEQLGIG